MKFNQLAFFVVLLCLIFAACTSTHPSKLKRSNSFGHIQFYPDNNTPTPLPQEPKDSLEKQKSKWNYPLDGCDIMMGE